MAKTVFSTNLRLLRKAKGISQQQLAAAVGLKRSHIASYEAGAVMPSAVNFLRIAYYFEVLPALLLEAELQGAPQAALSDQQRDALLDKLSAVSTFTQRAMAIEEGFREYLRMNKERPGQEDLRAVLAILETLIRANQAFGVAGH